MEDQYPSLPGTTETVQPGILGMKPPSGFSLMATRIEIHHVVRILGEEALHDVLEPVAMYSSLVHSNVVTGEHGFMVQTLQLQEKDALDQGPGVVIKELQSVFCSITIIPNCDN